MRRYSPGSRQKNESIFILCIFIVLILFAIWGYLGETYDIVDAIDPNVEKYNKLIDEWNTLRFSSLWPVQNLPPGDALKGMQDRQARRMLKQMDEIEQSGRTIRTICETGFFRGGSSLFWLMRFPYAQVHTFDKEAHPEAIRWFKDNFGFQWTIYLGPSQETLRDAAHAKPKLSCDLVFVDGSHEGLDPYHDIRAFRALSHARTIVIADDTFDMTRPQITSPSKDFLKDHGCSNSWKRALDENVIRRSHVFKNMCYLFGRTPDDMWPLGQCSGEFIPQQDLSILF